MAASPSIEPFGSLAALRGAHAELLRSYRSAPAKEQLYPAIDALLREGQRLGALLDNPEERWSAQGLLDYWVATLDRAGRPQEPAFLDEFDPAAAPELPDAACPYVGLSAFDEAQQELFFGRRRVVEQLVALLQAERLLAIVGPSGSGKSSVVRAGLLPALRQDAIAGSAGWRVLGPLLPGSAPRLDLNPPPAPGETLLVVVDQFEELFTLCHSDELRAAFIAGLVGLASDPAAGHRVVLTMRSDFEPFATRSEALYPLFERGRFVLPPLAAADLREAIEAPAARVGLRFEAGVVDALLQDLLGEPAALPLLQFSLLRLWEERERNRVTMAAYVRVGGGRLSLARAADELYNGMLPEDQRTAERILLRLVSPGEGLEVTSSRLRRADLLRIGEDPGRVERVLGKLLEARLLKLSTGPQPDDVLVEVAHEALVRNWPTLADLIDGRRAALRQRRGLTAAAEQWLRLDRDPGALLRGPILAEAAAFEDLSADERAFVEASRRAEQEEQEQLRRFEQAQADVRRARRLTYLFAALGVVSLLIASLAWLALSYYSQLQVQQQAVRAILLASLARLELAESPQRALLLGAEALAQANSDAAAAQARLALFSALGQSGGVAVAATGPEPFFAADAGGRLLLLGSRGAPARLYDLPTGGLLGELDQPLVLARFLVDGRFVGASYDDEGARLLVWTAGDAGPGGQPTILLERPGLRPWALAADDEARRLVVALGPDELLPEGALAPLEHELVLIDLARPEAEPVSLERSASGAALPLQDLRLSPDGGRLAAVYGNDGLPAFGAMELWDLPATGTPRVRTLGADSHALLGARFTPDGRQALVARGDGRLLLWDAGDPDDLAQLAVSLDMAPVLALSPDGRWLALSGASGRVSLFGLGAEGPRELSPLPAMSLEHPGQVVDLQFAGDGRWLVAIGRDGSVSRLATESDLPGQLGITLRGHDGPVVDAAVVEGGGTLLTLGQDGQVRRWYLATFSPAYPPPLRLPRDERPYALALGPSNDTLIVGSGPRAGQVDGFESEYPVYRWGFTAPGEPIALRGPRNPSGSLAISPDGRWLAAGSGFAAIERGLVGPDALFVWDLRAADPSRPALTIALEEGAPSAVAFTPSGSLLAAGSAVLGGAPASGVIRLIDLAADDPAAGALAVPSGGTVLQLGFSADGRRLYAGVAPDPNQLAGSVVVWEVDRLRAGALAPAASFPIADELPFAVTASPDGRWLAAVDRSLPGGQEVVVWDLRDLEAAPRRLSGPVDVISSLAFSPDGRMLVSGDADRGIWLWDLESGDPGRPLQGHRGAVFSLAFGQDGRTLLSGDITGLALLWDLERHDADPAAVPLLSSAPVTAVALLPGSSGAVVSANDGTVRRWSFEREELVASACAAAGRALRPEDEWAPYFGAAPYAPVCPP